MTSPTGDTRPLHFPLNRNDDIESETPNIPEIDLISLLDWQTSDPTERVDIVLKLSLDEYVALATCIDVGRDIAYGNNSIYLWWLWCRSLQTVSICNSIIDCINDQDSGVADAITALIAGGSYESSREYGQSQNNSDLSSALNPTCDLDILYGQARQLVDYLDELNTDFFEIYEVASNTYEFIAEVVGDITFIDETSIDAALAWVEFINNSIAENYAAQVTVAYKEEVACEIFCKAQDNDCAITPKILFDIFKDRLSASVTIESVIWDTLDFLAGGSWSGSQIADFMFFSQIALRSQLGKYFGKIAYQDIQTRLSIYSNDPDPDWVTVCDTCIHEICFDMTDFTDLDIIVGIEDPNFGDPLPSAVGVDGNINQYPINVPNQANTRALIFKYVFDHDVTIKTVKSDVYCDMVGWGANPNGAINYAVALRDASQNELYRQSDPSPTGYQSWVERGLNPEVSGVREVWVWSAVTTTDTSVSGTVWHDNMCITYTDD